MNPSVETAIFGSDPPAAASIAAQDEPSSEPAPARAQASVKDFTKRRNWPQQILAGVLDLLLILSPEGRILYLSPSCAALTQYEPQRLIGYFFSSWIHQDDLTEFIRQFNRAISESDVFRMYARFRKENSTQVVFEMVGYPHRAPNYATQAMFISCRPYPTGKAVTMDAFLEHKMLNLELKAEVAELRRQLAAEVNGASVCSLPSMPGLSSDAATVGNGSSIPLELDASMMDLDVDLTGVQAILDPSQPFSHDRFGDQAQPFLHNGGQQDGFDPVPAEMALSGMLDSAPMLASQLPLPFQDPSAVAPLDSTSYATDGAGPKSAVPLSKRVCRDCGVSESPEWRRGPGGPKTLCNACGLRYAKMKRKSVAEGDR